MFNMERYLKKLEHSYAKKFGKKDGTFPASVKAAWDGRSVILTGNLPTVEERYEIGSFFAKHCKKTARGIKPSSYKGLVNDIRVNGKSEAPMKIPVIRDKKLEGFSADIVIIGAGYRLCNRTGIVTLRCIDCRTGKRKRLCNARIFEKRRNDSPRFCRQSQNDKGAFKYARQPLVS